MKIIEKQNFSQALLTRKEAAEYLGCTEGTLATWKCSKRYPLPYVKIGRNIRYRLVDLQDFVENNINTE
jgi:excisionase family DNA binding protein